MSAATQPVEIESIRRLDLKPGDTLVLKVADALTEDESRSLRADLDRYLPEHKAVILSGDLDLVVLSAPGATPDEITTAVHLDGKTIVEAVTGFTLQQQARR